MPVLLFAFTGIGLLVGALVAHYWSHDSHAAAVKAGGVGATAMAALVNPPRPPVAYKGDTVFSLTHCQWGYCVGAVHGPKGWEYNVVMEDYESDSPRRFMVNCSENELVR